MYQEVVDQVRKTVKKSLCQVHTALPGLIEEFDPETCLAAVTPIGTYTCSNGVKQAFPKISGAPVVFPFCSSDECGFAFPVEPGDPCLLVFSENELDELLSEAETTAPLRFDLSNAIVIPGLMKTGPTAVKEAAEEKGVIIAYGETRLKVKEDGIEITGDLKIEGDMSIEGDISTTGSISSEGSISAGGSITAGGYISGSNT